MSEAVLNQPGSQQNKPVIASLVILTILTVMGWQMAGQKQAFAVLIGAIAGFSLYHASFGFTSAWRKAFAEGRSLGLRYQFMLIILTCAVSYPLIAFTDARGFVLPISVGMMVGSFIFGMGMQFGSGCGSGTLFTAGGGSTRMMITLTFFIVGSVVGSAHVPFWNSIAFPQFVQSTLGIGDKFSYGAIKQLGPLLAFVLMFIVLGTIALVTIWLEKRKHGELERPRPMGSLIHGPWSPMAGVLGLSLVGILSLIVLGQPWGITFAFAVWGAKVANLIGFDVLSWPYWSGWRGHFVEASVFEHSVSMMDFGIMAGAMGAAGLAARFKPVFILSKMEIATAVCGGFMLGYGARLAYGCNIGAYLGGLASGSVHGWMWALMAFLGSSFAIIVKKRLGL